MKVRTRFAPSPTGFLHIGGARTTLFNWLYARHHKGEFVLRIEDTDEVRSTEDSVTAILDSIKWMGMDWDEGPIDLTHEKGPHAPYYQMRRVDIYKKHLDQLLAADKAYHCYCTKEELDKMRQLAQLEKRPPKYDGRCRNLSAEQRKVLDATKPFSIRFKFPTEGATVVNDMVRGDVSFENSLQQDFVIWKTTGGPTYNFAVVIDDHLMEITHVTRGDEHLSNTPSQLQLYKALGWEPPRFAHLSMIMGPDGGKLSKRHGATSVLEYKTLGFLPEAMRNYLALLGWSTSDSKQIFEGNELIEAFDLAGCQKSPATFDQVKLTWMNGEYMRKLPVPELIERAKDFLAAAGLYPQPKDGPSLEKVVALEREKYKLLSEIPPLIDFFYKPVEFTPKAKQKAVEGRDVVAALAEDLKDFSPFEDKALEARIRKFCEDRQLKTGQVFHPLRAAVSGRTEGPTLFLMLEVMGRDTVIKRLRDAASLAAV